MDNKSKSIYLTKTFLKDIYGLKVIYEDGNVFIDVYEIIDKELHKERHTLVKSNGN